MPIEQQWVVNIPANDTSLMFWHELQLVKDENTLALTWTLWLDYPHVALRCLLDIAIVIAALLSDLVLLILKVFFELFLLLRQDKSLWYEVEIRLRILFLHFDYINRKSIFSRELKAQWEMIDFLRLVQSLIEISLTLSMCPEHVPVMPVCIHEPIQLKNESD